MKNVKRSEKEGSKTERNVKTWSPVSGIWGLASPLSINNAIFMWVKGNTL